MQAREVSRTTAVYLLGVQGGRLLGKKTNTDNGRISHAHPAKPPPKSENKQVATVVIQCSRTTYTSTGGEGRSISVKLRTRYEEGFVQCRERRSSTIRATRTAAILGCCAVSSAWLSDVPVVMMIVVLCLFSCSPQLSLGVWKYSSYLSPFVPWPFVVAVCFSADRLNASVLLRLRRFRLLVLGVSGAATEWLIKAAVLAEVVSVWESPLRSESHCGWLPAGC